MSNFTAMTVSSNSLIWRAVSQNAKFLNNIRNSPFSTNLKKKAQKVQSRKKNLGGIEFEGFGEDDDPFGDSKPSIETEAKEANEKKKRGKVDADYDMDSVEEQLQQQLVRLKEKLSELRMGRPALRTFELVPIALPTMSKVSTPEIVPLSEIAQITIKSAVVVVVRLFKPEYSSRTFRALKAGNKQWQITDEGSGQLRIDLPKATKETRNSLIEKAKSLQRAYLETIMEVENDVKDDIKKTIKLINWGQREIKRLQNLVKPFHQNGKAAVQAKIKELSLD